MNPLLAWARISLESMEMLSASARVIHHRTNRRNTPAQLFAMGNEKVQAAVEASHAMTRHWLAMRDASGLGLVNQWAALVASGMAPFHAKALSNARRARRR
jgi:hypothetical protein